MGNYPAIIPPNGVIQVGANTHKMAKADDDTLEISLASLFPDGLNFYGAVYDKLFLCTNGFASFGQRINTWTPAAIDGSSPIPAMYVFWSDVDTRNDYSPTQPLTNNVFWDIDLTAGMFTATWLKVERFSQIPGAQNTFQLQIIERNGNGDFDMVFRYHTIQWMRPGTTGEIAHAGWTNGIGNVEELSQSGTLAMAHLAGTPGNYAEGGNPPGVYVWQVRGGAILEPPSITCPPDIILVEGYSPVHQHAEFSGNPIPTVTLNNHGASEIVDNYGGIAQLGCVIVNPGLTKGTYPITMTASNGIEPDATCTLNVIVGAKPAEVTCPADMTLDPGYAATSTQAITVAGTEPITLSINSATPSITLNDTTSQLDIAEGLTPGYYDVEVTATNDGGSATCTFTLTVPPVPPRLTCPDDITLPSGYDPVSGLALFVEGVPEPTAFSHDDVDGHVTFNDSDHTFDISEGLTKGEYPVIVTASNGIDPDATCSFTITVLPIPPSITCPPSITFREGYDALSTDPLLIEGDEPIDVTFIADDHVTWNDETKCFDIAEGLTVGDYVVEVTATNDGGSDTCSFKIAVLVPCFPCDKPRVYQYKKW